jgi:hypothetical protein
MRIPAETVRGQRKRRATANAHRWGAGSMDQTGLNTAMREPSMDVTSTSIQHTSAGDTRGSADTAPRRRAWVTHTSRHKHVLH